MSVLLGAELNVSRETLAALEHYAALLEKWNARINLVAPTTIAELWQRHIIDSAQIFDHALKHAKHWVDLGSGGGLPGVVCAVLAREMMPDCRFTLIESDKRKAAFLMTAARELSLPIKVLAERVEQAAPQDADIVSARALAPLPQLLPLVARHLGPKGTALLPKGKTHATELAAVQQDWQFEVSSHPSQTDDLARVLVMKELSRA